ncbi:MAG: lipopolysaccharide biosynthesis protein [Actinobacteria bacterium]|nr:lipopolysaccharide biosynthesis protein [Actinomycetota bacterium]
MANLFKTRQGAGTGSAYVAGSFFVSGMLTYIFQGLSTRFLGEAGYGDLIILWSTTFLVVQVLWIGISQTLGRYVSEREARGEDWRPVIVSARRLQTSLLAAFLLVSLLASPFLVDGLFGGSWFITAAFLAAVAAYAPEYFRRGTFSGHRQFARLGALHVAESSSRALIAAILLVAGAGVVGPALAIVLAPLVGVLLVRPASGSPPDKEGEAFSAAGAFRFAGPVLACVAFAQLLMNGGPILVDLLGGTRAQVGVFGAALILTRVPQYVLSPVIGALLPHASRILATEGPRAFERFVGRALGIIALVGILMVGGTWLLGEWGMGLFAPDFDASRALLVGLAALAAFYILSDTLNQALFARGRGRLAALGWLAGLPVCGVSLALLRVDILERVSYSLALGTLAAAASQATFYLATRERPATGP